MTSPVTNTDELDALRQKIDILIENAPKEATGRPPTTDELEAFKKFKADVKQLLEGAPPGSGLTYKSIMKRVKASQNPKPAVAKPKKTQNEPEKKPKSQTRTDREIDNSPPVDYLCVLDFEATCNDGPPPKPQEIIEFPTLLVNAKTGEIEDTFHYYIKPDVHPTLSPFCTDLTGITQDMVDAGVRLDEALVLHRQWLDHHNIISEGEDPFRQSDKKRFLYLTCGDWDLKTCLFKQLDYHGKETPNGFRAWVNVKHAFTSFYHNGVRGMTDMLRDLGLSLEGRHHSGIDDCKNIARICRKMLEDGWVPRATKSGNNAGGKNYWNFHKARGWPSPERPGPCKTVYLIRHGQSLGQATDLGTRKTNKELTDCGLTEKGRKQARDVAGLMGPELLGSVDLVISSPLMRALGTAVLAFPGKDIVVNFDLAEAGRDMPENKARPLEDVLRDLATDIAARKEGSKIDVDSHRPDGWPNPTHNETHAKRIRKVLRALCQLEANTLAIVCHYNVIKTMIVGKQRGLVPENAIPIKCALFEDGDVELL